MAMNYGAQYLGGSVAKILFLISGPLLGYIIFCQQSLSSLDTTPTHTPPTQIRPKQPSVYLIWSLWRAEGCVGGVVLGSSNERK